MADLQKRGGLAAIAGALLAIAGNAVVLAASPAVPENQVSYPLSAQPSSWARSSSRSLRR